MKHKKVAIIFGGKSAEHEVSLMSATNIYNAIDRNTFEPVLLGISREGEIFYNASYQQSDIDLVKNNYFSGASACYLLNDDEVVKIFSKTSHEAFNHFNIAFPIIHGTNGEDGTIQGLLKSLNVPFVGCNVLASAVCMDKDITKKLLRDAGIPVTKSITVRRNEAKNITYEKVVEELGTPLFVKPCNAGSSVGVSKVIDKSSFEIAIVEALKFDKKLLIEEAIIGKEIECAVLGNDEPEPSILGEIIPKDFYTTEAKYKEMNEAQLKIPADLSDSTASQIKACAVKAFIATECEGIARVDFFLRPDNTFVVNEINTLPGFTNISMYPKLWEHSGISQKDLLTRLLNLAEERYECDGELLHQINF